MTIDDLDYPLWMSGRIKHPAPDLPLEQNLETCMKILFLALAALASTQAAHAMPFPNLDQVKVLKCTVLSATGRNSFIPPQKGDTFIYATWQDLMSNLKFERPGQPEQHPYVSLPTELERVDHSGFRHDYLRTFVGIRESLAQQLRREATLTVKLGLRQYVATYEERARSLPDGEFSVNTTVNMECEITELDL